MNEDSKPECPDKTWLKITKAMKPVTMARIREGDKQGSKGPSLEVPYLGLEIPSIFHSNLQ